MRNQRIHGRAVRRRIHRIHEWTLPQLTQLVVSVAIVRPEALGRAVYDFDEGIVGRHALQQLQVAHEDALELRRVGRAVRVATRFSQHVAMVTSVEGQGGDGGQRDVCRPPDVALIRRDLVELDQAAEDNALVVGPATSGNSAQLLASGH
jgi:hypothetical protein